MTSKDGHKFILHVKREDGLDAALVFPHDAIPNIIECAAMQIANGLDDGKPVATAFHTTGFQVGHGPKGETVLNMLVGETGKISFLLAEEMMTELGAMLMRAGKRH